MNARDIVGTRRCTSAVRTTAAVLAIAATFAACVATASADQRKFVVMLAVPTKSVPGGDLASLQLPNPNNIWDAYFDTVKDSGATRVDSFAEYWNEISYGSVSVSGSVFGWVEVPWPVLPSGLEAPTTLDGQVLPFTDLNDDGFFNQFQGEELAQAEQAILIDYNGARAGVGTEGNVPPVPGGLIPETADYRPAGLIDYDIWGRPVWTPGERFRDLNGNGRYDALLEPSRDGWAYNEGISDCCFPHTDGDCDNFEIMQAVCEDNFDEYWTCCDWIVTYPDGTTGTLEGEWTEGCAQLANDLFPENCSFPCSAGQDTEIEASEFCDWDGDGEWDFPEPFEDFLVIYNPSATNPRDRWIPLDGSTTWGEAYIRANYPGDADALIARCGNGKYDGPDRWIESGFTGAPNGGSKLQQKPAGHMWVTGAVTPSPETDRSNPWSYKDWWEAYWYDKHVKAGFTTIPNAPSPPEWNSAIPDMQQFDPANPSIGTWSGNTQNDLRDFNPNRGGTSARLKQTCMTIEGFVEECKSGPLDEPGQMIWCATENTYCVEPCEPTDLDEANGCINPPLDEASLGDGSIASWANGTGFILPDTLDDNGDGIPDYYDGPAE